MTTQNKRHIVDIFFVLALFCIFSLSALMLISLGSNIYERTVTDMSTNYDTRTAFAYITEKVRQGDINGGVEVLPYGDKYALKLSETIEDKNYNTLIYLDDNHIKELFCEEGADLSPIAGQNILPVQDFQIKVADTSLLCITIISEEGESRTVFIESKTVHL